MAASLLRTGRLNCIKFLQFGSWSTLTRVPPAVAFSTKSGSSNKCSKKKTSDKKQAKTYFDIEKLVQHKPFEMYPTATAAKPAEQNTPSTASLEYVAILSAVEPGEKVVEISPSAEADTGPAITAEATPVVEVSTAIEAVFEPTTVAGAVPVVASSIVATGTEAIQADTAVAEAAAAPVKDLAEVPAPASGADAVIFKFPVEAATQAPVKMANGAKALEAAPFVEAVAESISVEAPPLVMALEPLVKVSHVDVASEPVAEVVPSNAVQEVQDKAAHKDVIPEPSTQPLAEAPTISVAPQLIEVVPTTEAAAEFSVSPEIAEELVDHAPVVAEAAEETLQKDVPPETPEAQMDPIQKLFLDSIHEYLSKSQSTGGLVGAGSEYEKTLAEEIAKLQRLYGGGDLTSFPKFKFKVKSN